MPPVGPPIRPGAAGAASPVVGLPKDLLPASLRVSHDNPPERNPALDLSAPNAAPAVPDFIEAAPLRPADMSGAAPPTDDAPSAPPVSFARKTRMVAQALGMTLYASSKSDVPWLLGGAVFAFVAAIGLLVSREGAEGVRGLVQAPLSGAWSWIAAFALGGGFAVASVRSIRRYVFGGMEQLRKLLVEFVPARGVLEQSHIQTVRFYFGLLQFAAVVAFTYELLFQLIAFSFATWGIVAAFPAAGLFEAGSVAPTLGAVIAFWFERVFQFVDGPAIFGFSSGLTAKSAMWGFGLAIVLFKLGVIATLIRLVTASVQLRPSDLSADLGRVLGTAA